MFVLIPLTLLNLAMTSATGKPSKKPLLNLTKPPALKN